jgi:hypothetical protein
MRTSSHNIAAIAAVFVACCTDVSHAAPAAHVGDIPQTGKPTETFVCQRNGAKAFVDRNAFLFWLADNYQLRRTCAKGPSETLSLVKAPDGATACNKEEKQSLYAAQYLISALLSDKHTDTFKVTWPAGSTPEERRLWLPDDYMLRLDTFFGPGGQGSIECLKASEKKPKADQSFHVSDLKVGTARVKLRLDQGSLEADATDKEEFKKAKSAQFSVADDHVSGLTKFDVKATVGLDTGMVPCGTDVACKAIPYVKWDWTETRPKPGKTDTEKNTFGTLGYVYWAPRDSFIASTFVFDAQYIVDRTGPTDTEVLAGTAKWKPAIRLTDTLVLPDRPVKISDWVYFAYEYGGVIRYGESLASGGNSVFDQQKTFLYYGAEVDLWFFGAKDTPLDKMKLSLHYNQLYAQKGIFGTLPFFNAELSYALDKDGNIDIKLTYERGREYETFEERNVWKTSLGYKF